MGFVVLALGVLMVVAGAYEMVSGSGDILSERGWSAYIVGAVLIGSGTVTGALGLTLRALDRLRLGLPAAAVSSAVSPSVAMPPIAMPDRREPAVAAVLPHDLAQETAPTDFGPATVPVMAAVPAGLALAEVAHAHETGHETARAEPAAELSGHHPPELPEPPAADHATEAQLPPTESPHDDWLDHNFAALEREVAGYHPAVPPRERSEPATLAASDEPAREPEPQADIHDPEPQAEPEAYEPAFHAQPEPEPAHESAPAEPDGATVSARETPPPATSQVIGRYESEGTSYVMYADGSIDAQSEAGVYRFASMAELKAFIES